MAEQEEFQRKVLSRETFSNILITVATTAILASTGVIWKMHNNQTAQLERERIVNEQNKEIHAQFIRFMNAGPRFTNETFENLNKSDQLAIASLNEANKATMDIARDAARRTIALEKSVALIEQKLQNSMERR